MAIKVTLTNKAQQTQRAVSDSTTSDSTIQLSRILYQKLRSLVHNKTISSDYDNDLLPLEYKDILEEFGRLQDGEEVSDSVQKLDQYLAELGIDAEYFYSKDTIDVEPWLEVSEQFEYRNVIDRETGDNIIDRETGYNVIHNTVFEG